MGWKNLKMEINIRDSICWENSMEKGHINGATVRFTRDNLKME